MGNQLQTYINELMEDNNYIRNNLKVIRTDTNIVDNAVDNMLYDIYETLKNGIESMEEEIEDYFNELESLDVDGVYDDFEE